MGGGQGFWLQSLVSPLGFMLDLLQKLLWTILLSTFLLQPYLKYCFPMARRNRKLKKCKHIYINIGTQNAHRWSQRYNSFTTSIFLALLYLHHRAWNSKTISLGPTHRHCLLPTCCSEWLSHCPCSSCTYRINSHLHPRVISSANRKIIIKQVIHLTETCR